MKGRTPFGGEFYAFLLITGAGHLPGRVARPTWCMIYLSMEFLSITSYVLAGYLRERPQVGRSGAQVLPVRRDRIGGHALRHVAALRRDRHDRPGRHRERARGQHPGRPGLADRARRSSCCWPASASRPAWCRSTSGRPTPTKARRPRSPRSCPPPPRPPGFAILMRVFLDALAAASAVAQWIDPAGRGLGPDDDARQPDRPAADQHQAPAGLLVDRAGRLHPDRRRRRAGRART